MPTLDDTDRLLDLLKEAGDEPVTLDELAIVGVPEPARLLQALEREGTRSRAPTTGAPTVASRA
jgi:hypothetical protein